MNKPTIYSLNNATATDFVISVKNKSVADLSTVADDCLVRTTIYIENIISELEKSDLDQLFKMNNIDSMVRYLNNVLINIFDQHESVRTVKITIPKAP